MGVALQITQAAISSALSIRERVLLNQPGDPQTTTTKDGSKHQSTNLLCISAASGFKGSLSRYDSPIWEFGQREIANEFG